MRTENTGMASKGPISTWEVRWRQALNTIAVIVAMSLPFAPRALAILVIIVALIVFSLRAGHGWSGWRPVGWTGAMSWMALFYVLHVVAMVWSSNLSFGAFDLEVKGALLLFPVLFWFLPPTVRVETAKVWRAFGLACAATVLLCLGNSALNFGNEWQLRQQGLLPADPAWTNHFFESRFSLFLHPSYMAMYLCFALASWSHDGLSAGNMRRSSWFVPSLLILGVILCNSKMGWLTLALVLGNALWVGWRNGSSRRTWLLIVAGGATLFTGLFIAFPTVSGKLTQALGSTGAIDPNSDQSSALRRMAWDAATDMFMEHPITGVGTGDVKDELVAIYHAKGYVHAEAKRMNAHSQFLQSAAALGVMGLLVCCALVLVPMVTAVRNRDRLSLLFWSIILLNWSVESMAEVQAGVLFVGFLGWSLSMPRNQRPAATGTVEVGHA